MRDKAKGNRVAEDFLPTPSPPVIRAMANTLCDHNINACDPHQEIPAVLVLLRAGFGVEQIEDNFDEAIMMAAIRQRNEGK